MTTVGAASPPELGGPLRLLEGWLREGEPVADDFVEHLGAAVEAGNLDVLAAREGGQEVGVLVLAYRPSVSLGGPFASIEDLYVTPGARRRGVGRALLEAAGERCAARGVSYVEAQVENEGAAAFYAAMGYEADPGVRVFAGSQTL